MGRKKKKQFIDKKKATSFNLVQRSQNNANEGSSQYVLQPVYTRENQGNPKIPEGFPEDCLQFAEDTVPDDPYGWLMDEAEEGELGYDYDYEKHMRTVGTGTVVASNEVEQIVIRNQEATLEEKAIPELADKPDFEMPEEVKADAIQSHAGVEATKEFFTVLEQDGQEVEEGAFEEILDDFVLTAMQEPEGEELEELKAVAAAKRKRMGFGDEDEGDYDEGDNYDEGEEYGEPMYKETADELEARELEAREQRPIDDEFELALLEYDEENLGELDPEEDPTIAGTIDVEGNFETEMDEFATRAQRDFLPGADMSGLNEPVDAEARMTQAELTKQKIDAQIRNHTAADDDMKSVCSRIDADFAPVAKEKWDCESIISTYSNTDNHPKMIPTVRLNKKKHIKISTKTGIPIGYFPTRKPDTIDEEEGGSGSEYEEEEDEGPAENLGEKRNKKETKAEKKARKAATKAARRERRAQKKELKQIYTEETSKLHKTLVKMQAANPVVKKLD